MTALGHGKTLGRPAQGVRNVSLALCENICERKPARAAMSYVHDTRWCWPEDGIENISMASNVTSGVVGFSRINQDKFNNPFTEATGLEILGCDLYPEGLRNISLDQCRHACQATSGCVGFSYVPKKSWCFRKYDAGQYRDQLGVIFGVINED